MTPAMQHHHLRGALSKAQTMYILSNGIMWHHRRAGRSSCSLCQRGIDSLDSRCPVSAFMCNTKKCQDELSGKAFVVPNSSCVSLFPNIGEPALVTRVGGINCKSLTE